MIRRVYDATHEHGSFRLRYGHPLPFGASPVPGGVNFSIYSKHATACTLVLFPRGDSQPIAEIPFPKEFQLGDVFCMVVFDIDTESIDYAYRFDGPHDVKAGHHYNPKRLLLDPFAKQVAARSQWALELSEIPPLQPRGRVVYDDYDWGHDRPLENPAEDLIIYEMHLRGFTRHSSSGVKHPGTLEGLQQKIEYLKDLGINCIELMPVFEFDELENLRTNPQSGERLCNYWGYSTLCFYAPKAGFAATGHYGEQVNEFKDTVKLLHEAGIEVMLDVVFNHTSEAGENGPVHSFKGIDNKTYYLLEKDGSYANFTGCGNTLNCNHPVVRDFVLQCLRYWAAEYHVDGFRFDLASVLGRGPDGHPLTNPPLLEALANDPVLAHCELIAEAWDAAGLYQVGRFPAYGRWSEWNGKFRDAARKFLKGDNGVVPEMVQRILGSPDLYQNSGRNPQASVNFITCHDGFTLRDLFSYNQKHNFENGEGNIDGANDNNSWNCGIEGETSNEKINQLRLRLRKNAMALLLVSQGIPMIYMGDECGRTQRGNNNAYCHDTEWNWLDWTLLDRESEMFRFTKAMIAFRKANPIFRSTHWLTNRDQVGSGYPDISWHGVIPWRPDWSYSSHSLAFMLCGRHSGALGGPAHFIYCAFNMHYTHLDFTLPVLPKGLHWFEFANTGKTTPDDIHPDQTAPLLANQKVISLTERSCVILVGK